MSLQERIAQLKEEEKIAKIKLETGKFYKAKVLSASLTTDKNDYETVEMKLEIIEEGAEGKKITKKFVIDENNKSEIQSKIALGQLTKLLESFKLEINDEKSLVLALMEMKGKEVFVNVKYVADKKNPEITYTNYTITKDAK